MYIRRRTARPGAPTCWRWKGRRSAISSGKPTAPSSWVGGATFAPALVDFGPDARVGSTQTVQLWNLGAAERTLVSLDADRLGWGATAIPGVLPPGGALSVAVTLDADPQPGSLRAVFEDGGDATLQLLAGECAAESLPHDEDGDGWDACGGDCDDGDGDVHPATREVENAVDDDCDGVVDDDTPAHDDDGDGFAEREGDCDDGAPSVFPGAEEAGDGVDEDCDGRVDEGTEKADDDGDGFTEEAGDCDDADPSRSPRSGC